MSRIQELCKELNARGEGVLIGHLMAGDPDLVKGSEYARALIAGGLDVLELGIPFSDPMADGPTLQAAGTRALKAGTTPTAIFELVKGLRREAPIPIVLMTYYNPVLSIGEETFLKRSLEAGVDGVIVSDLPVEEAASFITHARRHRIDTIFLATPETPDERLKTIASETIGFLYIISRKTADQMSVNASLETLIRRIRALVLPELPIAVGFGISHPAQVGAAIRAGAQGVIVESVLAERIATGSSPEQLREFVQALKADTRPTLTVPAHAPQSS
ncbi:MAG: tryptophan synthase subunit alpha [Candidatus Fraserbacteria bacterium RBG_16_55_9]|uniref:Tryptophan synthase alpha chain n=1 Tax=Fraserbacteria sp. (strain RBG_16_55_9) TaxID=1817864 RepID=A0A1F5UPM2_FRAXR|nr:MAG: tryptophan synthase subunit alpha [Candidatus Fraserbacteria bacterium RBG_16_55_9]